jgi:hypothetical protein
MGKPSQASRCVTPTEYENLHIVAANRPAHRNGRAPTGAHSPRGTAVPRPCRH